MSVTIKAIPRPGMQLGSYPELTEPDTNWLERTTANLSGKLAAHSRPTSRQMHRFVRAVNQAGKSLKGLGDRDLKNRIGVIRQQLYRDGLVEKHTIEAFALVREAAHRTIGMRHFDVQLMGGWVMLQGMLAEMETGEGKTLTATLPACTAALAGIPVHIITVNDYLVSRDAENMRPVYDFLGLKVGIIIQGMDEQVRRAAYERDVTYCSNKVVAFDYLRDRIVLRNAPGRLALQAERLHRSRARLDSLLMRGLCFAIVDEADSVLIDEACTPLIISSPRDSANTQADIYLEALSLARKLSEHTDYIVHAKQRDIQLTGKGKNKLAGFAEELGGHWRLPSHREDFIRQALSACHLYQRDREYLVKDGKVQIIDDFTGRTMPDRSWERGLHQLIEAKEDVEITQPNEALARISYQRFYRRYLHLAGMTGTAREAAGELRAVYDLKVLKIPTHKPSLLKPHPDRIFTNAEAKWQAVIARLRTLHEEKRPVLIGTRSVADSDHLSTLLTEAQLPHQVLNARQDSNEADLVACAGEPGCITVATNMAGRGTDIPLAPGVAEAGGLHVIAMERNEARRIDRQLFGRCARQGDPGSYESILSLEDEIIARFFPKPLRKLAVKRTKRLYPLTHWWGRFVIRLCQRRSEREQRQRRRQLEKMDEYFGKLLAFAGRAE